MVRFFEAITSLPTKPWHYFTGRAGLGGARACPAVAVLQLSAGWPAGGRAALRPPCPHGRQRLLGPLRPPVSVKQVAGWAVGVPQSAPVAHLSGSNRNQPHLSQFPASQRREEIEIQDQRSEEDPEPRVQRGRPAREKAVPAAGGGVGILSHSAGPSRPGPLT